MIWETIGKTAEKLTSEECFSDLAVLLQSVMNRSRMFMLWFSAYCSVLISKPRINHISSDGEFLKSTHGLVFAFYSIEVT